jgi:hypothetical protein
VKEGSKARKEEAMIQSIKYPFTYLKETITVRKAKQDVSHRSA